MKQRIEYQTRPASGSYPTLADAKSALPEGGVVVKLRPPVNPDRPDGDCNIARWFSEDGTTWRKVNRV